MVRRIRWQILIAFISCSLVLGLMSYLAITTAAVQRPVEGGDYVEAILDSPGQINPLISDPTSDPGAADIQALIFDGLVRIGPNGLPEPALAQNWILDETGQVYTFELRNGITWHDGEPITSDDVLFTIRVIQGPAFTGNPALRAIWRNALIDSIDQQTVMVRLDAPFAPFLEYATFPILPSHILENIPPEAWSSSAFAQQPIGSGPYQVESLNAERILLRANPRYYRGRPYINSIELRSYANAQLAMNDLVRGTIEGLSFSSVSELRNFNLPRTLERHSAPLDGYTLLAFNIRSEPLSDLAVRRALAAGLDREALIEQLFGDSVSTIDTPILPQWWAAAPETGWYPSGRERAITLLAEAGFIENSAGIRERNGTQLAFELLSDRAPDRLAVAQEIASQWAQIGVQVSVIQLDAAELQQRLAEHRFTMAILIVAGIMLACRTQRSIR
jgi:peptide/nickel transport system substrate-binding protein